MFGCYIAHVVRGSVAIDWSAFGTTRTGVTMSLSRSHTSISSDAHVLPFLVLVQRVLQPSGRAFRGARFSSSALQLTFGTASVRHGHGRSRHPMSSTISTVLNLVHKPTESSPYYMSGATAFGLLPRSHVPRNTIMKVQDYRRLAILYSKRFDRCSIFSFPTCLSIRSVRVPMLYYGLELFEAACTALLPGHVPYRKIDALRTSHDDTALRTANAIWHESLHTKARPLHATSSSP